MYNALDSIYYIRINSKTFQLTYLLFGDNKGEASWRNKANNLQEDLDLLYKERREGRAALSSTSSTVTTCSSPVRTSIQILSLPHTLCFGI